MCVINFKLFDWKKDFLFCGLYLIFGIWYLLLMFICDKRGKGIEE